MNRAPRVVLDTNVVLSALIFAQGRLTKLRHAWQRSRCRPLASKTTAAELMRALAYPKFALTADEQRELLADYLPYCVAVTIPNKPPRTPTCRDPFDVPFLQLAIAGRADYLVTGDRDILELAEVMPRIITTDRFLEIVTEDQGTR